MFVLQYETHSISRNVELLEYTLVHSKQRRRDFILLQATGTMTNLVAKSNIESIVNIIEN